jgi:hypothetical protein
MTINLDDYEKAIVVLALRQFAQKQFSDAITALESGDAKKGNECSERGTKSSEIANRMGT